jgi:hypothetical protein
MWLFPMIMASTYCGVVDLHLSREQQHLAQMLSETKQTKQTPWPVSARELYRPSNRRLSAKLVLTFADRRVSRSQRGGSLTTAIPIF